MMRKLLFGMLCLVFVSCQITERMYLSESGMVDFKLETDFSAMMSMMTPEQIDSMKMEGGFPIDTVVSFADLGQLASSEEMPISAEEIKFRQSFDKTRVRLVVNENVSKTIMMTDRMSLADFNAYQNKIAKAYDEFWKTNQEAAEAFVGAGSGVMLNYKYNGKTFERISLNKKLSMEEELTDSVEISGRELLKLNMYEFDYHFPKTVKTTTLKDGTVQDDGKSVSTVTNLAEILEFPEEYNFKVEFE